MITLKDVCPKCDMPPAQDHDAGDHIVVICPLGHRWVVEKEKIK